ncbi:hypothetical protein Pan258_37080 [Symmachiella dynata]|uniref:hypothetical protein n=1 Tax=Symmachiella dynata TaxID=2527995 RepID=UPI001188B76F|nr:hypothetical protein [Symmachiella dynata]QDT49653.1 hypothetical protein Pan258_37080 [Symmachiella dynata]
MLHASQTPQRCELSTEQIRLVCELTADRWQHTLSVSTGGKWVDVLSSLEGSPQDESPASPVFQELLLDEKHAQLTEVQMFGRSGKCLYAVAVGMNTETKILDFDVSARFVGAEMPKRVTSSYGGGDWAVAETSPPVATEAQSGLQLAILDVPGMPPCEAHWFPTAGLKIGYGDLSSVPTTTGGTTIRWQYQVSWAALS